MTCSVYHLPDDMVHFRCIWCPEFLYVLLWPTGLSNKDRYADGVPSSSSEWTILFVQCKHNHTLRVPIYQSTWHHT